MDIRRVITGEDSSGRSRITRDGGVSHTMTAPGYPEIEIAQVWSIDSSGLLDTSGTEGTVAGDGLYPPPGGTRFLRISYPCGFGTASPGADSSVFARLLMHRTDTVDLGVVIEGELTLVLDDGSETVLRAGDLVVQNGVHHGWRNAGPTPAVVAFVLVGRGRADHHRATAKTEASA